MNIFVIILLILFSYIILCNIFNSLTFRENMMNQDTISENIGENKGKINKLNDDFTKTLQRSKTLYDKLNAAKNQSSLNEDAKSHPSIQNLNLKPKKIDNTCEDFQVMNESIYNNLNKKHINNKIKLSTIDSIITQINQQITKIKNKL
jgi:hypothetical protein